MVVSQLGLFSTLSHAAIMALLFGSLALLTRRVLVETSAGVVAPRAVQRQRVLGA